MGRGYPCKISPVDSGRKSCVKDVLVKASQGVVFSNFCGVSLLIMAVFVSCMAANTSAMVTRGQQVNAMEEREENMAFCLSYSCCPSCLLSFSVFLQRSQ